MAYALGIGALVSLAWFLAMLGPRPDIHEAMHTVRFDLKFVDTRALLAHAQVPTCGAVEGSGAARSAGRGSCEKTSRQSGDR